MACQLDSHPQGEAIAGWLRQGMTAAAINQQLRMLDPKFEDFVPAVFSRHRNCLGLAKLTKGRSPRSLVTAADIAAIKGEDVTAEEVKNLSLRTFYARLKMNPADVGMKELVSVIGALSRTGAGGKTGKAALEEAMSDLND